MIRHKTARTLMYDWHSGQASALYAAASSGLVADFDVLTHAIQTIDCPKDKGKLLEWAEIQQKKSTKGKSWFYCGGLYVYPLPWAFRKNAY